MSRFESQEMSFKESVLLSAAAIGLLVIATIAMFREYHDKRQRCIDEGQINAVGQKLEGFEKGRGCERFLADRKETYYYNIPYRIGSW